MYHCKEPGGIRVAEVEARSSWELREQDGARPAVEAQHGDLCAPDQMDR